MPKVYWPRCTVHIDALFDQTLGQPPIPFEYFATPKSVTIERNAARKADTCTVELDYNDFPFDPRLLQDVAVKVYIDALPLPDAPLIPIDVGPTANLRFVGIVDEPKTRMGADGAVVSFACRDYTGLYLDYKWPYYTGPSAAAAVPTLPTPPGTLLVALVERIRAQVTPLNASAVFLDPTTAFLDVSLRTGKAQFATEDEDSAWDVLTKLCDLFGLTPVWNLDQLEIRTANFPRPGGALMVFGANLDTLEFSRNLRKQKVAQVKVVAWNPSLGQAFEGIFPPDPVAIAGGVHKLKPTKTGKSTATPQIKQVQYNVEGSYTPADVLKLAEIIHGELAQQTVMGEIETHDMTDLLDGSILGLQNGDQLICKLGPTEFGDIRSMSTAELVAHLTDPSKPDAMSFPAAEALASAWTATQERSVTFYITDVTHKWSREGGYQFSAKFRDFVLGV